MDINTRIVTLQQVMSTFALTCPKNSTVMLSSAQNYHQWVASLTTILGTYGSGLLEYFRDGDMLLPQDAVADDPAVLQLTLVLNNTIQVILNNTVKIDILSRFQAEGLTGLNLLLAIRRDYSTLSSRQLFKMVQELTHLSSKQPDAAAKFLRNFRLQFQNGMTVDHLFGLFYLNVFNSEDANRRVLDAANPQLSFTAVESALRDLVGGTTGSMNGGNQALVTSKRNKKEIVCRRCQAKGHFSTVCTAPAPVPPTNTKSGSKSSSSGTNEMSWAVNHNGVSSDDTYTLDTGSTLHLTKNKEHLYNFSPSTGSINGISDGSLKIHGYGSVEFQGPDGSVITVSNVAYVPKATRNLISVKNITKVTGLKAIFAESHCELSNGVRIGTYMDGSLYCFDYHPKTVAGVALTTAAEVMHSKLGHPSPAVMKSLGYSPPPNIKLCPDCCAGKMTKVFPKTSFTKSTHPLELLHVDVCGPISNPGLNNEAYFLTIVDDFTRWTSIYPLVNKSETKFHLRQFITYAETHFSAQNFKVSAVRSDNGGEFCNKDLKNYFMERGIVHQLTVPYNSSQNGVAERKHRTVQEKARTLLSESGLSNKFWTEAVKTSEFLINRYPSEVINGQTSFQMWHNYAPNYAIFHPFGCYCMVLIPPEKRDSIFTPVASPGVMVGYSPTHKAYRCYVPAIDDIVVSSNVRFDDTKFPMTEDSSTDTSTSMNPSDIYFGAAAGGMPRLSDYASSILSSDSSSDSYAPSTMSASSENSSSSDDTSPHQDVPASTNSVTPDTSPSTSMSESSAGSVYLPPTSSHEQSDDAKANAIDWVEEDTSAPINLDYGTTVPIYDEIHQVPVESSLLPLRRPRSNSSGSHSDYRRQRIASVAASTTASDDNAGTEGSDANVSSTFATSPNENALVRTRSQTSTLSTSPEDVKRVHLAQFTISNAIHHVFSVHSHSDAAIPSTYNEALSSPDSMLWNTAINKELQAHADNSTWKLVNLPAGRRAIGCRWVFVIKDSTSPPTYKARLVAQGFRQVYGLDYFETFSPVVRYESIRILFALASQFKLIIHQMDVTTAFLNGSLDEEIYMKVPDGVEAPAGMVCKLQKSLYGLKQAPLCWNIAINRVLVSAGFKRSVNEFGIYVKVNGGVIVIVALYVDDLLICSNNMNAIGHVKELLHSNYKMKDLGAVSTFLGMEIRQTSAAVHVKLNRYLTGVLADFSMSDCNPVATPLASGTDFVPREALSDADVTRFRSMVGKILFAANTCRPDLAFAASTLSRFLKDPRTNHLAAAKHVLRYIKGTLDVGLVFRGNARCQLVGYSDADWAGDKVDRKSVTGYVFMLAGCAITWKTKKQQTVAMSSTEAEYMALGETVKELLWLSQLLKHIGLKFGPPTIFEDNEGCKLLSNHPVHHQRTKHIDIRHHFLRDHLNKNDFILQSARTDEMAADMFTKSLERPKFKKFVEMIGMSKC